MYWRNLTSLSRSIFGFTEIVLVSFCLLIFFLITPPTFAMENAKSFLDKKIILATEINSPLVTKGKPLIDCAFRKMGKTYQILEAPWKRAQIGTEQGRFDGFLMASRNSARDAYATFSHPFLSIEWLYVLRHNTKIHPEDPAFTDLTFAANIGSARLTWLTKKYDAKEIKRPVQGTSDPAKTLKMLLGGRYDVALENGENFKTVLANAGLNKSEFRTFTALVKPLAIYFGKKFLENNSGFLMSYNKSMKDCISIDASN